MRASRAGVGGATSSVMEDSYVSADSMPFADQKVWYEDCDGVDNDCHGMGDEGYIDEYDDPTNYETSSASTLDTP